MGVKDCIVYARGLGNTVETEQFQVYSKLTRLGQQSSTMYTKLNLLQKNTSITKIRYEGLGIFFRIKGNGILNLPTHWLPIKHA